MDTILVIVLSLNVIMDTILLIHELRNKKK